MSFTSMTACILLCIFYRILMQVLLTNYQFSCCYEESKSTFSSYLFIARDVKSRFSFTGDIFTIQLYLFQYKRKLHALWFLSSAIRGVHLIIFHVPNVKTLSYSYSVAEAVSVKISFKYLQRSVFTGDVYRSSIQPAVTMTAEGRPRFRRPETRSKPFLLRQDFVILCLLLWHRMIFNIYNIHLPLLLRTLTS